jgi:hypothetical protein
MSDAVASKSSWGDSVQFFPMLGKEEVQGLV